MPVLMLFRCRCCSGADDVVAAGADTVAVDADAVDDGWTAAVGWTAAG